MYITEKMCMHAIDIPQAFDYIPKSLLTDQLCLFILEKIPCLLGSIPEDMLTCEFCHAAVSGDAEYPL
jgi:hypothetical protein